MLPIIYTEERTCKTVQKCPKLVQQMLPSFSLCYIWITFLFPHHEARDMGYNRVLDPPSCFSTLKANKILPFKVWHHHNLQVQWGQNRALLSRNSWLISNILGTDYLRNWILHLQFRINISRIRSSFLPVNKKFRVCFCGWVTGNHQGFTYRRCEV